MPALNDPSAGSPTARPEGSIGEPGRVLGHESDAAVRGGVGAQRLYVLVHLLPINQFVGRAVDQDFAVIFEQIPPLVRINAERLEGALIFAHQPVPRRSAIAAVSSPVLTGNSRSDTSASGSQTNMVCVFRSITTNRRAVSMPYCFTTSTSHSGIGTGATSGCGAVAGATGAGVAAGARIASSSGIGVGVMLSGRGVRVGVAVVSTFSHALNPVGKEPRRPKLPTRCRPAERAEPPQG